MALAVDEACHGGGGTAPLLQLPLLSSDSADWMASGAR